VRAVDRCLAGLPTEEFALSGGAEVTVDRI
jgi:hypothetical protein